MKPALATSLIVLWTPASFCIADEPLDSQLELSILNAQTQVKREAVQFAARPMFNNLDDWQRWTKHVDNMGVNQIDGLMNILNTKQRLLLLQRQRLIAERMRQQWVLQQLWLHQNALANLPFGGLPRLFNQPRIAYAPIIQWIPYGIQLNATATISPDRRHVRMNLNPIFSSLGPIHHYNMLSGAYYQAPSDRQIGVGQYHFPAATGFPRSPNLSPSNRRTLPAWYLKNRNNP